jgi:hypothetical protein
LVAPRSGRRLGNARYAWAGPGYVIRARKHPEEEKCFRLVPKLASYHIHRHGTLRIPSQSLVKFQGPIQIDHHAIRIDSAKLGWKDERRRSA